MKLKVANRVIDKTEFSNYHDWETYPEAEYQCDCGQVVTINFRHLKKHAFSNFSNLATEDIQLIEVHIDDEVETKTNSFLDFYCPTCKKPVRFYYDSWFGGHHGESGYTIKYIVD